MAEQRPAANRVEEQKFKAQEMAESSRYVNSEIDPDNPPLLLGRELDSETASRISSLTWRPGNSSKLNT